MTRSYNSHEYVYVLHTNLLSLRRSHCHDEKVKSRTAVDVIVVYRYH